MSLKNHTLLKGTLILTVTGFITRIIGFIYKIYLADLLGAKMLGIYQLVFPVYGICFTIYGAGLQTAISQVIAAHMAKKGNQASPKRILAVGCSIGLGLACSLSLFVSLQADWIASHLILEPSLAPYLKIIAWMFPFCSATACISGYYYGISLAGVPAVAQIVEQISRVIFVFFLSAFLPMDAASGCRIAVWGLVIGEITANIFTIGRLLHHTLSAKHSNRKVPACNRSHRSNQKVHKTAKAAAPNQKNYNHSAHFIRPLLWLSITLTSTKLIVSILHSTESILIPSALRQFGASSQEALSIYGILTGMSLSFILFPSTIANSLAVMLLPNIANAHAGKQENKIKQAVTLSVKYSLLIGILCTGIFLLFGKDFGIIFFHNEDAGSYLTVLSWLCPFLYLGTTLTSIINGMGKTSVTFLFTMLSLGIKILFLLLAVPQVGIRGYLIGLLASQLLLTLLEAGYLHHYIQFDSVEWILFPCAVIVVTGYLSKALFSMLKSTIPPLYSLAACCTILCLFYLLLLILRGTLSKSDIQNA